MTVSAFEAGPTVEEVLRLEDLAPGELASRRAVVRWSDGTEGEALRWCGGDAVLLCEGDHGNSRLCPLGLRCTVFLGSSACGGSHNQ